MIAVGAAIAGTGLVRGRIPNRRKGLLQRLQFHRHILIAEMFALMVEPVVGEAFDQDVENFLEHSREVLTSTLW